MGGRDDFATFVQMAADTALRFVVHRRFIWQKQQLIRLPTSQMRHDIELLFQFAEHPRRPFDGCEFTVKLLPSNRIHIIIARIGLQHRHGDFHDRLRPVEPWIQFLQAIVDSRVQIRHGAVDVATRMEMVANGRIQAVGDAVQAVVFQRRLCADAAEIAP